MAKLTKDGLLKMVAKATSGETLTALKHQINEAFQAQELTKEDHEAIENAIIAKSEELRASAAQASKDVRIFCKYLGGHYPKQGLRFINGSKVISQEKLAQLKETKYWGREIALKPFPGKEPVKVTNKNPSDKEIPE